MFFHSISKLFLRLKLLISDKKSCVFQLEAEKSNMKRYSSISRSIAAKFYRKFQFQISKHLVGKISDIFQKFCISFLIHLGNPYRIDFLKIKIEEIKLEEN